MHYVYSVRAHTVIDGGAPGNFSLCVCDTIEDAKKYMELMNEALPFIQPNDEYIITESKFSSGYNEGIDTYHHHYGDQKNPALYIQRIPVMDNEGFEETRNVLRRLIKDSGALKHLL